MCRLSVVVGRVIAVSVVKSRDCDVPTVGSWGSAGRIVLPTGKFG